MKNMRNTADTFRCSYIVKVSAFVEGRRVDGEYDGGKTLAAARKEGATFVQWVKADPYASVKVCQSDTFGNLRVVEVLHGV